MNYSILSFLCLVGSLALFLFGMKMMSEALQKVAGARMKNILSSITTNRFLGLLTGIFNIDSERTFGFDLLLPCSSA